MRFAISMHAGWRRLARWLRCRLERLASHGRDIDMLLRADNRVLKDIGLTRGGAQIGFDRQSCRKVFGIVADWNWADTKTVARIVPNNTDGIDHSTGRSMDWFGTLRTRAGLAMNDTLVYVTGGLAPARIGSKMTYIAPVGNVGNEQFSFDDARWGWTGGAGAEFALAGGWSVNGEVLYMQFGKDTDTFRTATLPVRPINIEHYDSAWVGRVGVNYRWGAGRNTAFAGKI